jgi:hypothetical protein
VGKSRIRIATYKFGWLRGSRKLVKGKKFLVAGICNQPNLLVLPFRFPMVRAGA